MENENFAIRVKVTQKQIKDFSKETCIGGMQVKIYYLHERKLARLTVFGLLGFGHDNRLDDAVVIVKPKFSDNFKDCERIFYSKAFTITKYHSLF